jgi:hypothetical protein
MGIPTESFSFMFSFIEDYLPKDFNHINLLLKMGDIYVAFEILTQCFLSHTHHTYFNIFL